MNGKSEIRNKFEKDVNIQILQANREASDFDSDRKMGDRKIGTLLGFLWRGWGRDVALKGRKQ